MDDSTSASDRAEWPAVIVFEKRPRWAPELERQFANDAVRVVACRSLDDVSERSTPVARGVIVLDFEGDEPGSLRFLGERVGRSGLLPVFAMSAAPLADLEWALRELGSATVLTGSVPGHELADLCRRQWSTSVEPRC